MPFELRSGGAVGPGVSVSTQADIANSTKGYESEDENASRKRQTVSDDRPTSRTTMYSKQEFREQYCINNKQLDLLELEKSKKDRFLGCLSQYNIESPCSRTNRASFLSVCVRRRVPSDENLNTDYAPIQRYPRFSQPAPTPPELYAHDADLECSYFRRRPRSVCSQPDPKRYTWMPPEDEDFNRMEWPQSVSVIEDNAGWPQNYNVDQIASVSRGGSLPRPPSIIPCPAHTPIPPPPPPPPLTIPPHRTKHVSFARSHTLTTFDDSVMPAAVGTNRFRRDCERLIDGRVVKPENKAYATLPVMFQPFTPYPQYVPAPVHYPPVTPLPAHPTHSATLPRTSQSEHAKVLVIDSIKKGVMRTQATQTEASIGRKATNYLSLSPRTIKRVKMVAAGVQTNGFTVGARRLTKSFSEVGGERLTGRDSDSDVAAVIESIMTGDHEKLHRTQSEEPPRSPRSPTLPTKLPHSSLQRGESDDVTSCSLKSVASSQVDKSSEMSALQMQAQEYFQQNFQFIHESDRDDTIEDELEILENNMQLNRKNLEYLQQEIAKQAKIDRSLRSILSKSTSEASQKTINSHPLSKTSTFQSEPSTETSATTTDDSEKNEKEIIIDFEPRPDDEAIPYTTLRKKNRRILQKTMSEGEILLDARKSEINCDGTKDTPIIMSTSQENMTKEDRERESTYKQYTIQNYDETPIKDEGIFPYEPDGSFSSSESNAPYEDFHEKYISYKHESFRIRSISFEDKTESFDKDDIPPSSTAKSSPASPETETVVDEQKVKKNVISNNVSNVLVPLEKSSPCASNESLTVDHSRDQSDGLWNESQTTVLQIDSGTDNGTVVSSSDLSSLAASPGALALLTPTSRRKQLLLLQHQQRSSLDTDALDEELDASQSQSPTSPRIKLDTSTSSSIQQVRPSLSPPAVVPNINLPMMPITKQPLSKISPVASPKLNHTPAIAITHPSLDLSDVPFKRTPSFINKKRERALSPSRRQDLQRKAQQKEPNGTLPNQMNQTPSDPILPKTGSSDTSLARTDSGKLNTDVSESTTTTEDYVTANSDSSKRSNSKNQNQSQENNNKTQEGSSFESASSLYSSTKTDYIADDLIVPCFSPPLEISSDFIVPDLSSPPLPLPDKKYKPSVERIEVKAEINPSVEYLKRNKTDNLKSNSKEEDVPKNKSTRDTVSLKSSSSGSYSIGGSNPNILDSTTDKTPATKMKDVPEKPESQEIKSKAEKFLQQEQLVPKTVGSLSDDERSVHYSSSGYYESPADEDDDGGLTYKHSQKYRSASRPRLWLAEEKRRKKKAFILEFSKSYDDSRSTSQDHWCNKIKESHTINNKPNHNSNTPKSPLEESSQEVKKKKAHFVEKTKSLQSSPRENLDIGRSFKEKSLKDKETDIRRPLERERHVKRTKLKAKSPTQNKTTDIGYRTAKYERREGFGSTSMKLHLNIPTSDDSSEQYKKDGTTNGSVSPRKHRRLRDSPRRKGANSTVAKSPTSTHNSHSGYRSRRKSGSNESISLPGSLPRRKQSIPTLPCMSSLEAEDIETARTLTNAGSRLTPLRYIKSPNNSPRHRKHEKDGKFGKAASAESLRSVSPGSDSVFYSEQTENSATADGESKAHCLHCGKEVQIVTASHEHDSRNSKTSHTDESYADATPDIVPAPAGFADSPSCMTTKKHSSGSRLYKKLDKRYRSEDKSRHHYRQRQDVRAKSEERGKEEYASEKPQDTRIARSAGNSLDKLSSNADLDEQEEYSGSSDGAESRDEKGVYAAPWWCGNWILLYENDDQWTRIPPDIISTTESNSEDPTESETEFTKRYGALTHRLVHRRACIELHRRQCNNTFE
ncbi:uncharacterized protein LOC126966076 [Leptidea sinapis]|uniref:uncharacterized protein LOC126966076 n=1 Tax=Leptidea sinapis TaxID=189913 RepID=UPI0021C3BFFE|nr:uncharacterized protein LOC126966076 [Leptidea sinapis]